MTGSMADLAPLDGLRGVCCFLIVLGHTNDNFINRLDAERSLLQPDFMLPVTLFFLLSGIPLTRLYITPKKVHTWSQVGTFYRKRWGRLAPSYYLGLALVVYFAVANAAKGNTGDAWSFVVTPFFMQSAVLFVGDTILVGPNSPLWQVSVFWFGYLAFPVCGRVSAALPARAVAILYCAILTAAALVFALAPPGRSLMGGQGMLMVMHQSLYTRLPHFVAGVLMGDLVERARATMLSNVATSAVSSDMEEGASPVADKTAAWAKSGSRWGGAVCVLADAMSAAVVVWYVAVASLGYAFGNWLRDTLSFQMEFWGAPLLGVWLGALVLSEHGAYRTVSSVVLTRIPQWLCDCSYVVFCIHWPLLLYYHMIVKGDAPVGAPGSKMPAYHIPIQLSVVYGIGVCVHHLYDKPLRNVLQGNRARASPPTTASRANDVAAVSGPQTDTELREIHCYAQASKDENGAVQAELLSST